MNSLFRGLGVATLLHAVGLFGTIEWLVPGRRSALGGGVAIGLVAALALLGWTHHATMTRFRPVREVADASRGGPTLALLAGTVRGLSSAFWPFLALLIAMYGAFRWALAGATPESGLLGLVGFSLGMSGAAAFLKALDFTGVAVDAASGIIGMTIGGERRDVRGRLGLLDASGTSNHAASSALMGIAALPSSALFVAAIVEEWTRRSGGSAKALDASDAAVLGLACAFGLLLVVFGFSQTVQAVVQSARRVLDEVRRQLRDRDLSDARAGQPVDYHPCSDMAGRFALRQMVMTGLSSVGLVILLIVVLRVIESKDREVVPGGSVSTLIIVATVAAILGSLFASGAGGAWGNAKNYIVTGAHGGRLLVDETGGRAENPTFVSSVIGDTVGDPIKDVAIPFTLALVKLVPVFVLVLLPLLL